MSICRALGVFLQALGRPAEAYVAYHRAAMMYTQSRERPYACSALINCVEALLDQGKHVEASAVMGQVDGRLKEMDPPPEWLLRDVDLQAALDLCDRIGSGLIDRYRFTTQTRKLPQSILQSISCL